MLACNRMPARAYHFLDTVGHAHLPNPHGLPVFLVRRRGDTEYERQPARSIESAVCEFVKYASVKAGMTLEVLSPGMDPLKDKPFTYQAKGKGKIIR